MRRQVDEADVVAVGLARALMSVQPTWPPAPPLFTTTIGWPRCFSAIAATMRAPTSVLPPAGKATISCTGLVGNPPPQRPRRPRRAASAVSARNALQQIRSCSLPPPCRGRYFDSGYALRSWLQSASRRSTATISAATTSSVAEQAAA